PNQYLLGVLIDGKYYFDARTTNDRELVMPTVLKSLGWNIYRLWTVDWMERADDIVNDIVAQVDMLTNRSKGVPITRSEPQAAGKSEVPLADTALADDASSAEGASASENRPDGGELAQGGPEPFPTSGIQRPYTPTVLLPVIGGTSETIYENQNRYRIEAQIKEVVDTEAPISKSLLYKRILQAWNISRAGAKLDGYLDEIINHMGVKYVDHHQRLYMSTDASLTMLTLNHYRAKDVEKRDMQDSAPDELVRAIMEAASHNLSIEEEELLRYLARMFGFAKVGRQIDELRRYALGMAEREGKIKRENGRVKWVG